MRYESVSQWIAGLKFGEAYAAQRLWTRYSARLLEVARRRLGNSPKALADEEDIALSVFHSVCRGAAAGRFGNVADRDDLWWVLLKIVKQKVIDHVRRETAQKRGAGRVCSGASAGVNEPGGASLLDEIIDDAPPPEYWVILEEEHQRLLGLLRDDRQRQIANRRIEGAPIAEIAEELGISSRSVDRKLRLIRDRWAEEFPEDEPAA